MHAERVSASALAAGIATIVLLFLPATGWTQTSSSEPAQIQQEQSLSEAEAIELVALVTSGVPYPHDRSTSDYQHLAFSQNRIEPPKLAKHGDPSVDGDTAYRLFLYFWSCVRAAEPERADKSLEVWAERAAEASGSALQGLSERAERMAVLVERCLPIPPATDRFLESFLWLGEAARLDHEVAQIDYYERAHDFLKNPLMGEPTLLQRHPDLIVEFKETARYSLQQALERGHPQAYIAKSQALTHGVVFANDPFTAYAYAHAAELTAGENRELLNKVGRQKYILTPLLTTAEIEDAKQLARRMGSVGQTRN